MNDWADSMAGRIKKRIQDQQVKDVKFNEKQKIKRSKAARLWQEVREQVAKNCEALNAKTSRPVLTVNVAPASELHVRADVEGGHLFLHATFDEEASTLVWGCEGGRSGQWEIHVDDNGSAAFVGSTGMPIPTHPAKMDSEMLTALLGF
jgi:hypothetical protein